MVLGTKTHVDTCNAMCLEPIEERMGESLAQTCLQVHDMRKRHHDSNHSPTSLVNIRFGLCCSCKGRVPGLTD